MKAAVAGKAIEIESTHRLADQRWLVFFRKIPKPAETRAIDSQGPTGHKVSPHSKIFFQTNSIFLAQPVSRLQATAALLRVLLVLGPAVGVRLLWTDRWHLQGRHEHPRRTRLPHGAPSRWPCEHHWNQGAAQRQVHRDLQEDPNPCAGILIFLDQKLSTFFSTKRPQGHPSVRSRASVSLFRGGLSRVRTQELTLGWTRLPVPRCGASPRVGPIAHIFFQKKIKVSNFSKN